MAIASDLDLQPAGHKTHNRFDRHSILIILVSLYPLIPMPIAGGVPYHVALLGCIIGFLLLFGLFQASFDRFDQTFLILGLSLFFWELMSAIFHNTREDGLMILARGFWIVHSGITILALNEIYRARGLSGITTVLALSVSILMVSMLIGIIYFPKWEVGRQLGLINIPFPRSTGVPNSDGKVGTFLVVILVFGFFARWRAPLWQQTALVIGPWFGLMATQSRSTLLAFFFVVMICWIFACMVSRNLFATALRILIGVTVCSFLILNFSSVFDALQGEGIYERNVQSRAIHVQDALEKIPENPVFGGGVKYTTIDDTGAGIHNSFLNFSVKSGVPSAIILLLLVTLPIMLFGQNFRNFMLASAMSIGIIFELLLYPGMVNENIVLMFLIVKFSAHYSQSSDFRA